MSIFHTAAQRPQIGQFLTTVWTASNYRKNIQMTYDRSPLERTKKYYLAYRYPMHISARAEGQKLVGRVHKNSETSLDNSQIVSDCEHVHRWTLHNEHVCTTFSQEDEVTTQRSERHALLSTAFHCSADFVFRSEGWDFDTRQKRWRFEIRLKNHEWWTPFARTLLRADRLLLSRRSLRGCIFYASLDASLDEPFRLIRNAIL